MDKFIYAAFGVGALILAVLDQSDGDGPVTPAVAGAVTGAPVASAPALSSAMGASGSSSYVATASPAAFAMPQPVNPIPRANALAGKVIDDRFQPDG